MPRANASGKQILAVVGVLVTVFTFYILWEAAQNAKASENAASARAVERAFTEHSADADRSFREIGDALRAQQVLLQDTRDTLIEVNATQRYVGGELSKLRLKVEALKEH